MKNVKTTDINRTWHLFDAKKEVLGRLSTKIALILMGKNKSYYTPYLDTGDFVDTPIHPGEKMMVLLAYGQRDDLTTYHERMRALVPNIELIPGGL